MGGGEGDEEMNVVEGKRQEKKVSFSTPRQTLRDCSPVPSQFIKRGDLPYQGTRKIFAIISKKESTLQEDFTWRNQGSDAKVELVRRHGLGGDARFPLLGCVSFPW